MTPDVAALYALMSTASIVELQTCLELDRASATAASREFIVNLPNVRRAATSKHAGDKGSTFALPGVLAEKRDDIR